MTITSTTSLHGYRTEPTAVRFRRGLSRWWREEPLAVIGGGFLIVLALVAIAAPLVAPADPIEQEISNRLSGPTAEHLLGTDDLGRDVLSRLIHGTRASLGAAVLAVGVALAVGVPIGLFSGYVGGVVDIVLMRIIDTILSFPAIVLAIGVAGALGPNLVNSMVAVGIVFAPSVARIMRGQTLTVREELYVAASTTFGTPKRRILRRHVLPNGVQPVIVQATLLLAGALLAEASLSFLGLGVQPPNPSWGSMLGRAYSTLSIAPGQVYPPGLMIVFTSLAFNTLGDAARRQLDPRQRR